MLRGFDMPSRKKNVPHVGMTVCDCKYTHQKIIAVDGDDLILEDGSSCSFVHCCDLVPHEWKHPVDKG